MSSSARAAFAHPDFRRYQAARAASIVAAEMEFVAIGWQVYAIRQNPLDLGYVGLAQFFPFLLLSVFGGHVADRHDRRAVLMVCDAVHAACSAALVALTLTGTASLAAFYALLVVLGATRAFHTPAAQALLPSLVPARDFANAVTWGSSLRQLATILGPAVGGGVFAAAGAWAVYALAGALMLVSVGFNAAIRTRTGRLAVEALSWASLSAGFRYVWRQRVLLGALSLDLFAVFLGGVMALLPVFASDVLQAGPTGLGLLRSAPAVGAAAMAVTLAYLPLRRRAGPVMLGCVATFGAAIIVFGLSRWLWLSVAALVVLGAADMVSMVVRHTLAQLSTPPQMRGRVGAVNAMFIGASNELGEFESGLTAALLGTVPAVIAGGLGTLAVVAIWTWRFPELRRVDRLEDVAVEAGPTLPLPDVLPGSPPGPGGPLTP